MVISGIITGIVTLHYTVYVLHSIKHNKIYIGFTSDLNQRILSHNEISKKGWTVRFRPWKLVYSEQYDSKEKAMEREIQLKSAKGRQFIWDIIHEIM